MQPLGSSVQFCLEQVILAPVALRLPAIKFHIIPTGSPS